MDNNIRIPFRSRYKDLAEEFREHSLQAKDQGTRAAVKHCGQSSHGENHVKPNLPLVPKRSIRPVFSKLIPSAPLAEFLSKSATKDQHGEHNVSNVPGKMQGPSRSYQPPMTGSISVQGKQLARETKPTSSRVQRCVSLDRKPWLDATLKDAFLTKNAKSSTYKFFLNTRKKLSIFQMKNILIDKIHKNKVVIISGPTGCGKTSQVPQFILDDFIIREEGSICHVVCALTHRLHVKSAAMRVAAERDENVGTFTVGYKVGNDRAVAPPSGSILFCTLRSLLDSLYHNPSLSGISHIILDGIHERDTSTDVFISLLRDLLPQCEFKLIIMSATLNCEEFSKFFDSCPIINVPSCTYPIQDFYLEDIIDTLSFRISLEDSTSTMWVKKAEKHYASKIGPYIKSLENKHYSKECIDTLKDFHSEDFNPPLIVELLKYICVKKPRGAILVFLPSTLHISKLEKCLNAKKYFKSSGFLILPLHSKLSTSDQETAFLHQPPGVRKIIFATNIAETSVTFDDVVYVVDSGKMCVPTSGTIGHEVLPKACWISSANAKQRRGRAGRVQSGTCYKLYTRGREQIFDMYPLPQILVCPAHFQEFIPLVKKIKGDQKDAILSFLKRMIHPPDSLVIKLFVSNLCTSQDPVEK